VNCQRSELPFIPTLCPPFIHCLFCVCHFSKWVSPCLEPQPSLRKCFANCWHLPIITRPSLKKDPHERGWVIERTVIMVLNSMQILSWYAVASPPVCAKHFDLRRAWGIKSLCYTFSVSTWEQQCHSHSHNILAWSTCCSCHAVIM